MGRETIRTGVALHARPLDAFVRMARGFEATIQLIHGERQADGKNVLQLLLLAVPAGAEVTLVVDGPDEDHALQALGLQLRAGEEDTPPAAASSASPIHATSGAPGRAVGLATRPARQELDTPEQVGTPAQERRRLVQALDAATRATDALIDEEDPFSDIFRAQHTMLEDPTLRGDLVRLVQQGQGARQAVLQTFARLQGSFDALGPGFAAQRHADVADLRDRLLEALGAPAWAPAPPVDDPLVLLLEEATPARMATLDPRRVSGVVSTRGGPTSHAAIVARGRGILLLFAPRSTVDRIQDGQWLLLDGDSGTIELLTEAEARRQQPAGLTPPTPIHRPSTRDGHPVVLRANLGAPGELALARQAGAQGCGLLRTELLFAGRVEAPSVDEQVTAYARIARAMAPHPVVVRLFDGGADKPLSFLPEENSGPRGIELLLRHPIVLRHQLQAVNRARLETGCDLRLMVPMVCDVTDLQPLQPLLPPGLPLGVMVETPAAALLAGSIAARVSFLSIGSNDLTQYTLAVDRQHATATSRPGAGLHPAVARLMAATARAAREAKVECSVCGELAADPRVAPLLVGLGITTLSMSPSCLAPVAAAIVRWPRDRLEQLGRRALELEDPLQLQRLLATLEQDPGA